MTVMYNETTVGILINLLGYQNDGETNFEGHPAISLTKKVGSGLIKVILADNGYGRVFKPNGTKKTICEKSTAQLVNMLKQIESFYKF